MTIAPYMPFAMCASTGFVPQWYMKTPGSLATNVYVIDSPGATSRNATFGAMRAAWKSIECGRLPPFVSVILTFCPWRTWIAGPGTLPPNVQARYLTPGAISTVTSSIVSLTSTTSPSGTGGSSAGNGACSLASDAASAGAPA